VQVNRSSAVEPIVYWSRIIHRLFCTVLCMGRTRARLPFRSSSSRVPVASFTRDKATVLGQTMWARRDKGERSVLIRLALRNRNVECVEVECEG
jgi:hypothetical protein